MGMKILAFFAHPDDEAMLAGGTLALLARSRAEVHYLCATRGEGGELGEPPVCNRADLGSVRQQELACAVESLHGRSLDFLDYVDPLVGPDDKLFPYTDDIHLLAGQIAAQIRQSRADIVITHGSNGEYGHPAHVLSHQAARLAVESLTAQRPLLYTVAAIFPDHPRPRLANKDDPATLVLDIRDALEEKETSALCHRTQHALFVRRPSQDAGRQLRVPEVLMQVESLHRISTPGSGFPVDPLEQVLAPWSIGR